MDVREVADRVREARKARDLTQRDLARLAGVSRQTIENLEGGLSRPDLNTLLRISEPLGVSPAELLGLPAPEPAIEDEDIREVVKRMRRMPPAGRRHIRELVSVAARPLTPMRSAAS